MGEYSQSHTQAPLNSFKGTIFLAVKATSTARRIRTLCGEKDFFFMNVQTSAPFFISALVIFFFRPLEVLVFTVQTFRGSKFTFLHCFFHWGRGVMSENGSWHTLLLLLFFFLPDFEPLINNFLCVHTVWSCQKKKKISQIEFYFQQLPLQSTLCYLYLQISMAGWFFVLFWVFPN